MEKEFVSYEIALQLKELSFDEPCFGRIYADGGIELLSYLYKNSDQIGEVTSCSTPLYQQAFRWFREKYALEGVVQQSEDFTWYKWIINQYHKDGKKYVADWYEYKTYEEAELACLVNLIEITKNKIN